MNKAIIDPNYPYFIKLEAQDDRYWNFCRERLTSGTWKMMIPLVGNKCSYLFKHEEDLLFFRLYFGVTNREESVS
jgi:hypothetical protein